MIAHPESEKRPGWTKKLLVEEGYAMRCQSGLRTALLAVFGVLTFSTVALAQGAGEPGTPWRGAGAQPCFGPHSGATLCAPAPRTVALKAGRLFDRKSGQIMNHQMVLIQGARSN